MHRFFADLPVRFLNAAGFVRFAHEMRIACLLLCAAIALSACKQKPKEAGALEYPVATAKLVSHVTSGIIPADGAVQVKFVAPVIERNLVGQNVQKAVFSFDPAIDGVTRWKDTQTLEFQPNAALPLREQYEGTLDLQALLPLHKEVKSLEPLKFRFEVAGRELVNVGTDFRLEQEGNPSRMLVTGEVELTESVTRKALERSLRLEKDRRALRLEWEGPESGKHFRFTSEAFERGERESSFKLTVAKDPLAISDDYETGFTLSALKDLTVQELQKQPEGERLGLVLTFSDELDPSQDITGLISVQPPLEVKLKKIGKKVYLSGDFRHGESYAVSVSPGLRSRWSTSTAAEIRSQVSFEELKPAVKFASDGAFLPTVNNRKVRFFTLNLSQVHLEIKKVFASNLGQFLQTEQLSSAQTRNDDFNYSYVNRVGVRIYQDSLQIGDTRNQWVQHELDLTRIIAPQDDNLYLLHISFQHRDMLYGDPEESRDNRGRYYYGEDYYSNPLSYGYLYAHGNIFKPLILSDIGLTYKQAHHKHYVYATNIKDARPLSGVKLTLKTFQNQPIASKTTDSDGFAEFEVKTDEVFYIEAARDGQRSVIKPGEMEWNLSSFDTDGVEDVPGGTRAFIYTERGVYRPGDEINLSVVARNDDNTFPDGHPVTLQIFNPKEQKVYDRTNTEGRDGYYNFTFQSAPEDLTGNWRAVVKAGGSEFSHALKIETVAPFRLKVNLTPEKTPLTAADRQLRAELQSNYLFGNPAAGLDAEVKITLKKQPKSFPKYKTFLFSNETVDFKPVEQSIYRGKLNDEGRAQIQWTLPSFGSAPSALLASLEAKVFEKGGRPNMGYASIPVEPYDYYVGLQKPDFDYGYARVGAEVAVPAILVNPGGATVAGRPLNYRIYKGLSYWWWEFDEEDDYLLRFKSHASTELMEAGTLVSQNVPAPVRFTPAERGIYLVEVQDGSSGHTAGIFLSAYPWGESGAGGKDAGVLTLKTDKERYFIGEQAQVSFPAPREGSVLVSVERGQRLLSARWVSRDAGQETLTVPIPITAQMAPTAYVTVSIIQPHGQSANDRPIRTYGVVPLSVEDRSTRQEIEIKLPAELRAKEKFTVDIATADGQPTQFTIAVVDEGLLDLTRFATPDPWKHFFRKLRLGVKTFDLFSEVIGVNKGDVLNVFSIGGDMDETYRQSQMESGKKKRFKPVSMFRGPLQTDGKGKARVEFEMPNYVGSVRVMVVAAKGNCYANAQKTVPVKTELMVLSSLPRVLGPGDKFTLPVTVFAMKENIGKVDVSLALEGPLSAERRKETVEFSAIGEKDVFFQLNVDEAVGQAKVTVKAQAGSFSSDTETDILVRPSSPRIYDSEEKVVAPGSRVTFTIPGRGIPGSNNAALSVRRRPGMNLSNRLMNLVRYPYGCIEQTTSAVFPQLYLADVFRDDRKVGKVKEAVDRNINLAIRRLRGFQLPSGAFSYWPGNREPSEWGTNYAGHFMIEAKKLGYNVPEDLYINWLRYQQSMALNTQKDLMVRVYRVYLLALAGEPAMGAMNLLKENNLKDMSDTQKWLLAGAYQLAGVESIAGQITKNAGTQVGDYWEFGGSYGSGLRDKAMILEMQVLFENWSAADQICNELGESLSSDTWYSTQTTGYMLLAVGKYFRALDGKSDSTPRLAGTVLLPDGRKVSFDTRERAFELPLLDGFGQTLTVEIDRQTTSARAFAVLSWDGVPLRSDVADEAKNLNLKVEWLDDDGMPVDPARLTQGTTFWGHFIAENPSTTYGKIEEVALVQVLPSGWEVENTRLSGEDMPSWMSRWKLNREEYLDIRDDRVMWFFDFSPREKQLDFVVKLNAVSVGEFHLPPTVLEAMYNDNYKAVKAGKDVEVVGK